MQKHWFYLVFLVVFAKMFVFTCFFAGFPGFLDNYKDVCWTRQENQEDPENQLKTHIFENTTRKTSKNNDVMKKYAKTYVLFCFPVRVFRKVCF